MRSFATVRAQVRLTERRRMLCYNHLRMASHAAILYRTQFGRKPDSFSQLSEYGCAPGVFGQQDLRCPCGGIYRLSDDGTGAVCSHHGDARMLVPCSEIPLGCAAVSEANRYEQFVREYTEFGALSSTLSPSACRCCPSSTASRP